MHHFTSFLDVKYIWQVKWFKHEVYFAKNELFHQSRGIFSKLTHPPGVLTIFKTSFFSKTKVAFMKEAGHIQVWFGVRKILQLLILTFSLNMSLIKKFLSYLNLNLQRQSKRVGYPQIQDICPNCQTHSHTNNHVFNCTHNPTDRKKPTDSARFLGLINYDNDEMTLGYNNNSGIS